MLSKQLQEQIIEEGKERMEGWHDKMKAQVAKTEYELGAEKYAALYETALARLERAEKALKDIAGQCKIDEMDANDVDGDISEGYDAIINVARKALTPKTGEDE